MVSDRVDPPDLDRPGRLGVAAAFVVTIGKEPGDSSGTLARRRRRRRGRGLTRIPP